MSSTNERSASCLWLEDSSILYGTQFKDSDGHTKYEREEKLVADKICEPRTAAETQPSLICTDLRSTRILVSNHKSDTPPRASGSDARCAATCLEKWSGKEAALYFAGSDWIVPPPEIRQSGEWALVEEGVNCGECPFPLRVWLILHMRGVSKCILFAYVLLY